VLYMIIERFKNGDPVPVYRKFRDKGRRVGVVYHHRGAFLESVGNIMMWPAG
jgi:Domain of unknown function (DUF3303)